MIYIKTKIGTDWPKEKKNILGKVIRSLFWFIPEANPGYNDKMHLISSWLIEFDNEEPWREIALNENDEIVFAGPSEENYGFWLDANMKLNDFEGETIEKEYFEEFYAHKLF